MKLSSFLVINAILFVGVGIAFALYGPLLIAMFGVLETGGTSDTYWFVASFARLFGAALFGYGFLLWGLRTPLDSGALSLAAIRSLMMALLIANILALVVVLTQQVSIWGSPAGWVASAICLALIAGYAWFLAVPGPARARA